MSLQNLVEMEGVEEHPVKGSPGSSKLKPKPRPRLQKSQTTPTNGPSASSSPKPHPRQRRRRRSGEGEGESSHQVNDIVSISSISSGGDGSLSKSGYDNPIFQSELEDEVGERNWDDSTSPLHSPTQTKYNQSEGGRAEEEEEDPGKVELSEAETKKKVKLGNIWNRFLSRGLKKKEEQPSSLSIEMQEPIKDKEQPPNNGTQQIRSEEDNLAEDPAFSETELKLEQQSPPMSSLHKKPKSQIPKRLSTEESSKMEGDSEDEEALQGKGRQQEDLEFIKHPSKSRKMKQQQQSERHPDEELFGITIHGADLLPMDPYVLHPLVRVTLMTQDGREVSRCKITQRSKGTKNTTTTTTIPPIMTQCFRHQLGESTPTLNWNELLLFDEPFKRLIQENPTLIIFFEIMDVLPIHRVEQLLQDYHGGCCCSPQDAGWYKVAWAFLKPVGAKGQLHTHQMLRLQLFKPPPIRGWGLRGLRGKHKEQTLPQVFSWWKGKMGKKLVNTTLYVTLKGVSLPSILQHSGNELLRRQLLSMRKEQLMEILMEAQLRKRTKRGELKQQQRSGDDRWCLGGRVEGQRCRVPNTFLLSLPSSQMASLNLTIHGNVHSLKFSPCGHFLAAGLDTEEMHAVLLFEIPSGALLRSLKQHHGLIYDLCWKREEEGGILRDYLGSASADSTACIWSMEDGIPSTLGIFRTLHHPSFVYSVKFHPTQSSLAATASFDFIIRVWDLGEGSLSSPNIHQSTTLFILDQHNSFVNCLEFDGTGSVLFSGDGDATLIRWGVGVPSPKHKPWRLHKKIKLVEEGGRTAINSISLHPAGIRLLVHLRNSQLLILDSSSFQILKRIGGFLNDRLQIRSCFSPCGSLILSGAEDGVLSIWDSDSYSIADFISPKKKEEKEDKARPFALTSVDYHPKDFYVAVGLASSSTGSEPNPILLYGYEVPSGLVEKEPLRFKNSSSSKSQLPHKRGDSSEKFRRIIRKLDAALKTASTQVKRDADTLSVPVQTENSTRSNSTSMSNQGLSPKTSPQTNVESGGEEEVLNATTGSTNADSETVPTKSTSAVKITTTTMPTPTPQPKPRPRPNSSKIPIRRKEATVTAPPTTPSSPLPT